MQLQCICIYTYICTDVSMHINMYVFVLVVVDYGSHRFPKYHHGYDLVRNMPYPGTSSRRVFSNTGAEPRPLGESNKKNPQF